MMSSGINLVMTVIGFAVSTMFIVFVCTRLICARIQLRNARRAFPTASRSDLSILERGMHGLEPVVVASFPTKKFGEQFEPGQDTQCTVCLSEYQEKDVLRLLPFCGHTFHVTCIDIWLKQHSTCPVCRVSLRDSPDRKRLMHPVYSPFIRSLSPSETSVSDPCHFQFARAGFSLTTAESHHIASVEEDQTESIEARGSTRVINRSSGNDCNYHLKEHIESPSHS